MTPNPLARQRRLSAALLKLRLDRGINHAELSRRSGISASVISRTENPFGDVHRRANLLSIRRLLDALEVPRGGPDWTRIEAYAEDALTGRWWDAPAHSRMGDGQRTWALVEAGASMIREYAGMLLPGLVQTPEYAHHRVLAVTGDGPITDTDAIVRGRMQRQRQSVGGGEANYELVLEEQAIRRRPVPADVMLKQLHHLLALIGAEHVSVRVVPLDSQQLADGYAPRAPYSHVSYPDMDDPPIVVVDNVTKALLVTEPEDVSGYAQLHLRLREAALSDADSAAYIREAADKLAATM
ncbi:helix-turn-helix transcriptional regulator [Micromonospora sp. WMMD980]|uniref:helix-turn-helix domain-containing protein n=1 Tax=Micromonospora sp. WMMD980 TaxID=3016088 RepID=UPI002416C9DC|nr:helix-turn-helix transcriptional regulator [Micromonospora sp. WMMD980]MDG4798984.1 helix-turn-helix transcriptional regulator [Micromonospora sp. WMMD980]MDG4799012.1 helix-turn-helix transcriptional regulator [Micromonospora sp. WMMD980]MDG4799078.1 helix-turn-helix transcriptional regulator [Micromonospora sp. WMMD980]